MLNIHLDWCRLSTNTLNVNKILHVTKVILKWQDKSLGLDLCHAIYITVDEIPPAGKAVMYCFITKEVPDILRISNKTTPWMFSATKQSVECWSEKVRKELKVSSIWQEKLKMQRLVSEKKEDNNSFWPAKSTVFKISVPK